MSTESSRSLPEKPDLRHLKDQARDLVRVGDAPSLAKAQLRLAREFGFASWPKLKAHVESLQDIGQLKAAIDANDIARVQELMTRNPALPRAPLGYGNNGPLTGASVGCLGSILTPTHPECTEHGRELGRWMPGQMGGLAGARQRIVGCNAR